MRRAQIFSNIVIYVIGLIVIGLVILFGYQIIQQVNEDRCNTLRLTFASGLAEAIDRNRQWGTSRVVSLTTPCETAQVCMVDRRVIDNPSAHINNYLPTSIPARVRSIINESVRTNLAGDGNQQLGVQNNVFTISEEGVVEPLNFREGAAVAIQIHESSTPSTQCFEVRQGRITLRMEGNGRTAAISQEP